MVSKVTGHDAIVTEGYGLRVRSAKKKGQALQPLGKQGPSLRRDVCR
jgi:hypothetical protein